MAISSPSSIAFAASGHSIMGSPIFIEFLKNILAKLSAITQLIPEAFMAIGACSLEDPQPKFLPPAIIFAQESFGQKHTLQIAG